MNRRKFIKQAVFAGITGGMASLATLQHLTKDSKPRAKMPVLFLGHGSPMNAIEENEFFEGFRSLSRTLEKPEAIVCVSAHWETRGTWVTAMETPKTIHDLGGFPPELFAVQYPAPGSPSLAKETQSKVRAASIGLDEKWGLDHGTWSVLKHLYPKADVPVVQLSLDRSRNPKEHYELAKELAFLRERGVLVVGSGNMVHNLGRVDWNRLNDIGFGFDWAQEANSKMKAFIQEGNHEALVRYDTQGNAFRLSIPTPEHFLPLLYCLALKEDTDSVTFFNDKPVAGSLTMTSVRIG